MAYRPLGITLTLIAASTLAILAWRRRFLGWQFTLTLVSAAILFSGYWQAAHLWSRHQVLNADLKTAQQLGQHLIVGFTDEQELRTLIRRGLVGGVFITRRNIENKNAASIKQMIADWQQLRKENGLSPLVIASDQEGGLVSRMSPPLPLQFALGQALQNSADISKTAQEYGRVQGSGLSQLGITLNFAPVVDLDHGLHNPDDRYSKISRRALGREPTRVANAAKAYCAGLAEYQVQCTLKHFPGLGRVFEDTHADSASINTPLAELARSDLQPFRQLQNANAAIMLSHTRLAALDPDLPASSSSAVIHDLLRQQWQYQGLLITDDLGMTGSREQAGGSEAGAVRSLNAGVDYLLVAWDPALLYPVLNALLQAQALGQLDPQQLAASRLRIGRLQIAQH